MDDLVQWLGQQLDEDERIARATEWCAGTRTFNGWDAARVDEVDWEIRSRNAVIGSGLGEEFARHIAEWDPARVLREIDAKRRILNECTYWHDKLAREAVAPSPVPFPALGEVLDAVTPILRALALPYADRPGYRDDWRP